MEIFRAFTKMEVIKRLIFGSQNILYMKLERKNIYRTQNSTVTTWWHNTDIKYNISVIRKNRPVLRTKSLRNAMAIQQISKIAITNLRINYFYGTILPKNRNFSQMSSICYPYIPII